jgi:hypothetical protein
MVWIPQLADLAVEALAGRPDLRARVESALSGGAPTDDGPPAVVVHDPRARAVRGEALAAYLADAARQLADRHGRVERVATIAGAERTVGEYLVRLRDGGREVELPLAAVVDPGARDETVPGARDETVAIRIYHSLWPLLGRHEVRPPLLPSVPGLHAPDVVGAYFAAVDAGDARAAAAAYEPDGYFREPSGAAYAHRGREALAELYRRFFAGGGVSLDHCLVTDDGVRCALEYVCVAWGGVPLPPQAGIAVYARGPSGKIASAHVYDDIAGPAEDA